MAAEVRPFPDGQEDRGKHVTVWCSKDGEYDMAFDQSLSCPRPVVVSVPFYWRFEQCRSSRAMNLVNVVGDRLDPHTALCWARDRKEGFRLVEES